LTPDLVPLVLKQIFGVIHVGIGNLELHSGVNLTPNRKMCCIISSLSLADLASILRRTENVAPQIFFWCQSNTSFFAIRLGRPHHSSPIASPLHIPPITPLQRKNTPAPALKPAVIPPQ